MISKPVSRGLASAAIAPKKKFNKILVANRGEIAVRIMRAATELDIGTVGIFSHEDRFTQHRYKADESYLVGKGKSPVGAYLDIEGIVELGKRVGADAVHPGYGFLSENLNFARACEEAGITFIGPTVQNLDEFGDKTSARELAIASQVPVVPGTPGPVTSLEQAQAFCAECGFPVIIKASMGGGGKGMRVVLTEADLPEMYERASSEALAAFGCGDVFIERFVKDPRHIEVQILGDGSGEVVHLRERDCSVQRRHQKVLEVAPAMHLDGIREHLLADAKRLTGEAMYRNAGTVEFLVGPDGKHYFIEVNPRVQVEHTVTEEVTGVDVVQSQIRIAQGESLKDLGLEQDKIEARGFAVQCRVTTEDPSRDFTPDSGTLEVFRQPVGMGIRLDDGPGFVGANITPHYDSLLVKLTGKGGTLKQAAAKLRRALAEFRIRGVTTNIPFLQNVLSHEGFLDGHSTTSFIEQHPEMLHRRVSPAQNRASKLLHYIGNVVVNGNPAELGADASIKPSAVDPIIPAIVKSEAYPDPARDFAAKTGGGKSLRQIYKEDGPAAFGKAVRSHEGLLLTDTTWRDAHQSLLATRVRTKDLLNIAEPTAAALRNAYSIECWGGATFDVAMRFLRECPWQRLEEMRERVPDVPFQMLLRGANAVGYTSYSDDVVHKFCDVAVRSGMDVFRVFDSLNYIENMRLGIDAVGGAGGIVEAAVCYTGDVIEHTERSNGASGKYDLDYYLNHARELKELGAHVLCIKDMAGLLKPRSATFLISALRKEFPDLPIHVHTHDTAGAGVASMLACAEAGADAVDAATDAMSGTTSQPSMGAIVAAVKGTTLDTGMDEGELTLLDEYWEQARGLYAPFESGQKSGSAAVYTHEMPGGQYTNLMFQSSQLGLADRWPAIKRAYAEANRALGDIVKVTPSSKVVGDLAQFMVQNDIRTAEELEQKADNLSLPNSVVEYFQGYLGIPSGGFPEPLRTKVLQGKLLPNGKSCFDGRPGAELGTYDFDGELEKLQHDYPEASMNETDLMSHAMYPQVFKEFQEFKRSFGDASVLDTRTFVAGLEVGQEISFDLEAGKTLYITLKSVGEPDLAGIRDVIFDVNGFARTVRVMDESVGATVEVRERADAADDASVGAPMPGVVVECKVKVGDEVEVGDALVVLSAMKMETVVVSTADGVVKRLPVAVGDSLVAGDLVACVE